MQRTDDSTRRGELRCLVCRPWVGAALVGLWTCAGLGYFFATNLIEEYIQDQPQHHQRMSFQEEFRELCRRHGLELDEQYAWD